MLRNWYLYVLPVLRDHCSFDSVCADAIFS